MSRLLSSIFGILIFTSAIAQVNISSSGKMTVIVSPENSELNRMAVQTLTAFFNDRNIRIARQSSIKNTREGAVFVLETSTTHPFAKTSGINVALLNGMRDEGHIISVSNTKGRPIIYILGKTDAGVDAGVQFLLSKMVCKTGTKGYNVTIPLFKITRNPFFKNREATLCPTGRAFPDQPEVNYENWNDDQLKRYPQFFKASGFNSMQFMELITYHAKTKKWEGGYRYGIPKGKTMADLQHVLYTLMDATHQQGMKVSLYIWGSPPGDGSRWDDPVTRPARAEFYKLIAERYGRKVDHIITHWQDEGNEGGYITPLTASMFLRDEYKKHNPEVRVTCDAWFNPDLYKKASPQKNTRQKILE